MEIAVELRLDGQHYEELYRVPVGPSFDSMLVDEFRLLVWNSCYNRFTYLYGSYMGLGYVGLAVDPSFVGRGRMRAARETEGLVEFLAEEYSR